MMLPPDPNVRRVSPCDCDCHKYPEGTIKHVIACCTGDLSKLAEQLLGVGAPKKGK